VGALLLLSLVTVNYRAFREVGAPAPRPLSGTMAESS